MAKKWPIIVKATAQMWPRWVFDFDGWPAVNERLKQPGCTSCIEMTNPTMLARLRKNCSAAFRHTPPI